jgi:hypothetical protein
MAELTAGVFEREQPTANIARPILWVCFHATALLSLGLLAALDAGALQIGAIPIIELAALAVPQIMVCWWAIKSRHAEPDWRVWSALVATTGLTAGGYYLSWSFGFGAETPLAVIFGLSVPYVVLWLSSRVDAEEKLRPPAEMVSAVAIAQMFWLAAHSVAVFYHEGLAIGVDQLSALYIAILGQPIAAFWILSQADGKLPVNPGGDPKHEHISGLGVFSLIAFVLVIVSLGLWAAASGNSANISRGAGVSVIVGLALAFGIVAVAPFIQSGQKLMQSANDSKAVKAVGGAVSNFDGWLVFSLAGALGASQESLGGRYALLVGHLLPSALLGWFLPAPFGLLPLAWAFVGAMSIARRWAWIEEDRENAMLNRRFDGPHIKVGFSQDLRDEALVGFMSLFWLVPLALRQAHMAFGNDLFLIGENVGVDDFLAWLSFFGTELAKAVPFVDWAEIYQVRGDAPIHIDDSRIGAAQHVIFGTRIVVDLVFLAALLQAISISQRTAKLKDMFYSKDQTLNRLDPFTELKAFKNLVKGERGNWQMREPIPEPFLTYDEDRLEELRLKHDGAAVGFAAEDLIRRNALRTPELLVVAEAKRQTPSVDKLEEYLERVRSRGLELSVHDLKAAHTILSGAGILRGMREQIVGVIAEHWRATGAVSALCDVLISRGPARDPRFEVRIVALNGLYQAAVTGDRDARTAIRWAASNEQAARPRELAAAWLHDHPDWNVV